MKRDIESLLNDKELCKKLLSLNNTEDIFKEIRKYDFNIDEDELEKIKTILNKIKDNKLSDEELEKVAGGGIPRSYIEDKQERM